MADTTPEITFDNVVNSPTGININNARDNDRVHYRMQTLVVCDFSHFYTKSLILTFRLTSTHFILISARLCRLLFYMTCIYNVSLKYLF